MSLDGSGSANVYLKATCEWFRAEPMITQALGRFAHDHLPTVLAIDHDRAWMLMDPLPGIDKDNPPSLAVPVAKVLAQVQLASVEHRSELIVACCPDRGMQATLDGLQMALTDSVELHLLSDDEWAAARAMEPWLVDQITELYECGLPDSIGHGDLPLGIVAYDGERLAIYDLTDGCLTHPFLDAVQMARSAGEERATEVLAAVAEPWRQAFGEADVDRALELAPLVNHVFRRSRTRVSIASRRRRLAGRWVGTLPILCGIWPHGTARCEHRTTRIGGQRDEIVTRWA